MTSIFFVSFPLSKPKNGGCLLTDAVSGEAGHFKRVRMKYVFSKAITKTGVQKEDKKQSVRKCSLQCWSKQSHPFSFNLKQRLKESGKCAEKDKEQGYFIQDREEDKTEKKGCRELKKNTKCRGERRSEEGISKIALHFAHVPYLLFPTFFTMTHTCFSARSPFYTACPELKEDGWLGPTRP